MEQKNKKNRFGTRIKSVLSSINKINDYVYKNDTEIVISAVFITGLLSIAFGNTFSIILGITLTICSFFVGLEFILRKKYKNDILTNKVNLAIHISLIITLVPQLNTITHSSASFALTLIIIIYSVQDILYLFYTHVLKTNAKKTDAGIRSGAINLSFNNILVGLFILSTINFLFFKILLLFFVYGISSSIRERYLIEYIKSDIGAGSKIKKSVFSNVASINNLTLISLLLIFLLFYSDVFAIDSQSILYFYSTTAQVFAALLGIIVMFSILILQKDSEKEDGRKTVLKKGLVGFTILYILIIMSSSVGIVLNNLDYLNSEKLPENLTNADLKGLLSVSIFEFVILMIPMGLLYLYAMISDFLEWDATFETTDGQGLDTSRLREAEGPDMIYN